MGTGGGIRNVLPSLRADNIMVFNGDVLGGTDLAAVLDTRTTAPTPTSRCTSCGSAIRARSVASPPRGRPGPRRSSRRTQDPPTDQINAGCYVFRREIIEKIPSDRPVSVEREVFPALLADGARVFGHVDMSYWRDMGTPDDFVRGSADLVRGIAPSPALEGPRGESLVHPGAGVAPGALLIGGTVVGRGAEVGAGARLDGAVLFDGAQVEAGAVVERSIIGFGAVSVRAP